MMVKHTDDDPIYVDHYDAKALHEIYDTQHNINERTKKLLKTCRIIENFADDPSFTRQSKMLHSLYVRGRQHMISTITATQKFNARHPIIRGNATEYLVYRSRCMNHLETFIDEAFRHYR